jgi:DNA-binding NtrC family response regulator
MTALTEKSILAVDDEEVMLKFYREYFSSRGVSLRTATTSDETMKLLEERPADIVILDLKLAEASGKDLLLQIKSRFPQVRYVFVTAYATSDLVTELYRLGVYEVIRKPCTIRTIFETVEKAALASSGLRVPSGGDS